MLDVIVDANTSLDDSFEKICSMFDLNIVPEHDDDTQMFDVDIVPAHDDDTQMFDLDIVPAHDDDTQMFDLDIVPAHDDDTQMFDRFNVDSTNDGDPCDQYVDWPTSSDDDDSAGGGDDSIDKEYEDISESDDSGGNDVESIPFNDVVIDQKSILLEEAEDTEVGTLYM